MGRDPLHELARAVEAGRALGLTAEVAAAALVLDAARARTGFAGSSYVMALAGGTGVGKSSVLNALAGRTVSAVRAVRPTTDDPVAWFAADRQEELTPLLDWLGVEHRSAHADRELAGIAILDLPDVDSVRTDHRARVDELLPRIDAVTWVVDPEKYDDERQHAYLRELKPHADRLRVVLNKADRLQEGDVELVREDLERRMGAEGLPQVPIHVVSAASGHGLPELREALTAEVDAKAIVAAKIAADAESAIQRLAQGAGVQDEREPRPLLAPEARATAVERAQDAALSLVDVDGLSRQARAAVLARARRTGGGLLGRTVNLLARLSGFEARRADPAAHLAGWRRRGTLAPVLNPVRAAIVEAAAQLPPASRPGLLAAVELERVDESLERAIEAATRETALEARPPGSVLWPAIGVLQLAAAAVLLFVVAWYATLFLAAGFGGVAAVELPVLGHVPMPLALLTGALLASVLLGALLTLHATWIGHRFAGRVAARVRERVATAVEREAFGPLDRAEAARRELAAARSGSVAAA